MPDFTQVQNWGQLLTAMLTPFKNDGSVNFDEVARIANYLVDQQKNSGIVVSGTTGESPTLTEDEKIEILKVTLEAVGSKAAVIVGAGTYNTAESVERAHKAERSGAHGLMFVNPYYNRPGQSGLFAHFSACAASTGLPVMLYNIMPRSAINLETSTLLELIEKHKNIVAVKEASGNLAQIADVARLAPQGFRVLSGDDALTLPIMSVGGTGLVSVAAHIIGRQLAEMIEAFPTNPSKANQINQQLIPVYKALFACPSPVPVKVALSKQGFDCESVRLPLVQLNEEEKRSLNSVLNSFQSNAAVLV